MLSRGQTIGRYVVLGLVGRGGMGEVYAAYDPELDRKVAIKLLHVRGAAGVHTGQGTQDNGRARLLREAQAIAKLSHPNVVVIYDVGAFQDQVFIAMEFVEGQTVGYWMNAAPRAWADVLKVFVAAGRGLAAAHEKGLVHRDFKPDNVMIDGAGQVHVMDFGLARLAGDRSPEPEPAVKAALPRLPVVGPSPDEINSDSTATVVVGGKADIGGGSVSGLSSPSERLSDRLTQTGTLVGTPAYMAPEQFLVRPTDARTDQFSFCVALYEALYGERPFQGSNVFALTANVVQGNVRPPPAQTKVPPWIRKVLLRGLTVDPKKRWPSLIALLAELERNRADAGRRRFTVGAAAKLAGVWEGPGVGRTRETAAKLAVRQAFLATGKRYAAATFDKVKRVLDRYAADWTKMYTSICEATHTRGEQSAEVLDLRMAALQGSLQDLRALCQVFRGATAEVVENAVDAASGLPSIDRCADVALLRAVVKPPHDPAVRAEVDRLRAHLAEVRTLARVGRLADALKAILPLEPEVRATGYRPLLAETLLEKGTVHAERRELEAAGRSYEEALWTAEVVRHDEAAAEAATQLVGMAAQQARFELGDVWAKHAETVLLRMGGHDRLWGWLFNNLGLMRHMQGRLAEAIDYSQRAIAAKEKALGSDSSDLGSSIGNIAFYLAEQGDLEEAVKRGERAIQILEDALGPEHPRTALFLSNHSETLNQLGRFAEARAVSQRALAIFERETEPDGIFVTCALTALGLAYLDDGLTAEAQPFLERAVRNREQHEAGAPARLAEVHFGLARALWPSADQRVRARALAEQAREEFAAAIATPALSRALGAVDLWLRANPPTTVAVPGRAGV
jgi:serine/threonine protein kinase/tetratricopeptide (TPR) repeat protein